MASALRGDLQQEWVLVSKPGAMVRQIHERRTLSLQRAGKCFAAYGRNVLDSIVVAAVDRVWARHLPGYVARRTSPGGDRDGGGEMLDLEGAEQEEEAVSGGALIVDTPTEYDEMSHDDELVVRAIEFLIFPGFANYEEALRRTTTAARRFFLMGKRAAARHVVEWLPADALAEIAPGRCDNELHELDCWRAYMDAVSRHNEWRTYFFSQRPAPLDPAVRAAALANPGEVSYEVQAAANLKLEAYMEHMEKYTRVSESTRDAAITALRVTLLFDGGWMRDGDGAASGCDAEESQQREREIAAIRRMGVPQLAALLHHVLHESGLHAEATELVTVIADDGLRLYEDFDRAELGAFLQRIAESAVLLADTTIKSGQAVHPYPAQVFEEIAVDKAGALF
jgi:Nuclear pore protein 84 / 107